jgi:AcrR family transcriptional regulator
VLSKDETYKRIFQSVLRLDVSRGHLKWSISEVARASGITRSLIYYYLGKDKKTIFEEAASFVAQKVFSLDGEADSLPIVERIHNILMRFQKEPHLFTLFYLNRGASNEIGRKIRVVEKQLLKKLKVEFPQLNNRQTMLVYIMELGAIAYQDLKKEDLEWAREFVLSAINNANK